MFKILSWWGEKINSSMEFMDISLVGSVASSVAALGVVGHLSSEFVIL